MAPKNLTIIDVETTGLFPDHYDRIVEVAAIHLNENGSIGDQYVTLVNPVRDLGPTHIHNITASDVKGAPEFNQIVGDLIEYISGSVVIGHNVTFDLRFIRAELARMGIQMPPCPYACTLSMTRKFAPYLDCRKLDQICTKLGIDYSRQHSALHDARAVAELLQYFDVATLPSIHDYTRYFNVENHIASGMKWPSLPRTGLVHTRKRAVQIQSQRPCYISQLVSRLSDSGTHSGIRYEYIMLLDRVLEDRRVTLSESDQLMACARMLGLSQSDATNIHRQYMIELIRVALADGIITEPEKRDLLEVQNLLGLSPDDVRCMIDQETQRISEELTDTPPRKQTCMDGKTVCFTGTFQCRVKGNPATRQLATQIAEQQGMVVKRSVTKTLDFLVAADPDSLSGKARKAHQYGVRVIAEPVFWRLMGVDPE